MHVKHAGLMQPVVVAPATSNTDPILFNKFWTNINKGIYDLDGLPGFKDFLHTAFTQAGIII